MRKILLALALAASANMYAASSVTVAENATIYSDPWHGRVAGTAKAGTSLAVIEAYPMWYQIEYTIGKATKVWINVWNHSRPRDCDPCDPVVTRNGDTATITASVPGEITSDRNARLTPNLGAEVIGGIPAGTSAKIVAERPQYFLVTFNGAQGYVEASRVTVK